MLNFEKEEGDKRKFLYNNFIMTSSYLQDMSGRLCNDEQCASVTGWTSGRRM